MTSQTHSGPKVMPKRVKNQRVFEDLLFPVSNHRYCMIEFHQRDGSTHTIILDYPNLKGKNGNLNLSQSIDSQSAVGVLFLHSKSRTYY